MSATNGCASLINDGYTRDETIPACEWHPAVSIKFRPFTYGEKRSVQERISFHVRNAATDVELEKGIAAGEKISSEAVAKHIVEWDVKDGDGNVVAVTASTILRLEPHLSAKLYNLVTGEVRTFQEATETTEENDAKN